MSNVAKLTEDLEVELMKQFRVPKHVFLFPNGMVACCDEAGQHIPALQGRFSEVVSLVLQWADEDTIFEGWPDVVDGGRMGDWRCR